MDPSEYRDKNDVRLAYKLEYILLNRLYRAYPRKVKNQCTWMWKFTDFPDFVKIALKQRGLISGHLSSW